MSSKKAKLYFYIELDRPADKLEVFEFPPDNLRMLMKDAGVKKPLDLYDYDCPVFDSERKAVEFLSKYKKILKALSNKKICKGRDLPAILYKRRYIVQSLMRLKNQTYRSYAKPWRPGQHFNLHDQVYFLTVKLTSLTYDKKTKLYCYKFRLP